MGASSFTHIVCGKFKNYHEAYREACQEAREEYGNDYYNGKINNTDTPMPVRMPRFGTKAFSNKIEKLFEVAPKRRCYVVEITGKKHQEIKRRRYGKIRLHGIRTYFFFGVAPN